KLYDNPETVDFMKALEESLINNSDKIRYLTIGWVPVTKILSYLVNLESLNMYLSFSEFESGEYDSSLPNLKTLSADCIPYEMLTNLIENTKVLTEISCT